MYFEQNPQVPDDLGARLMALREVSAGIALPPGARIRAQGTMRRRRRALVSATSAAVAAAAVVFLVAGQPGRRMAVPPPATQVPVSMTTTTVTTVPTVPTATTAQTATTATKWAPTAAKRGPSAAKRAATGPPVSASRAPSPTPSGSAPVTGPAGDPRQVVPGDQVERSLFVDPEVWSAVGLLSGSEVAGKMGFDSEGYVSVHTCDTDVEPKGAVGLVDFASDDRPLGSQKVRDPGSQAKARALYTDAIRALAGCPDRRPQAPPSVRRFESLAIDADERAMEVYEVTTYGTHTDERAKGVYERSTGVDEPSVEYVAVGYTANGRFTVVRVDDGALAGHLRDAGPEVVARIGKAALNRLELVP